MFDFYFFLNRNEGGAHVTNGLIAYDTVNVWGTEEIKDLR